MLARMRRVAPVGWAVAVLLGVGACSGVAPLDTEAPALSSDERTMVRGQADAALEAKSYKSAWAQEVAAGADRERLAAIALTALEHRSGSAGDMFTALRTKWGPLDSDSRTRVSALVAEARRAHAWARALELELLTADDPPTFERAWTVYKQAPHDQAPAMLEAIQEARADLEESDG